MAQTIKLKRSAVAGRIPTVSDLALGEVAINTVDGKMYIKKDVAGTESIVEIGSGSATSIWKQYVYTAGVAQTVFTGADDNSDTLAYSVNFVEVFLNGILLDPAVDYTATNNASVVLTSAPATGDLLQIDTFAKSVGIGDTVLNSFTGDNSTTAFTLSTNPGDENNTSVFIGGVYQNKTTYSVSGTTLTFSEAPATAAEIEVVIGSRNVSLTDIADLSITGVLTASGGTSTNWNTAYGWGNHASAGYLTTDSDTTYSAGTGVTLTGTTFSLTDTAAKWTQDNTKISNWDTAYGWGNHASAGYYLASNPNGYTDDQTAAEILTAIKTVDGSGSGLDADLLDGQEGSYYSPAHSHPYLPLSGGTLTGTLTSQALTRTNTRISSTHNYPIGHYSSGDTVFEIDPTWSEAELASFFNGNVSWTADSTAPAGYAITITGGVSVGGVYGSGFPFIPVGTSDVFYMECYIKNVGTSQTHYMGSNEYNESFGSLGGNPGSYGYWVMANTDVGNSWTKVSAYITGFGNSIGQFKTGVKYWTPMALFNYGAGTGTRACVISGWKAIKVNASGNRTFEGTISSGAITSTGLTISGQQKSNIVAVAALDVDCSLGNYFTKTISGNSTFTFSNVPATSSYSFILELTHTSGTVTWPASVQWPNSSTPALTTGKTHLFVFITDDAGARWRGSSSINYVS